MTNYSRLTLISLCLLSLAIGVPSAPRAAGTPTPFEVAYAGSMGSLMELGIKPAIAHTLDAQMRGRAQGSTGLAHLIIAGSIRPDIFISATASPMQIVLAAGKASRAIPIARTEMVIAYSPKSRFAPMLAKAGNPGAQPWWKILAMPGFRLGRTDPHTDPQGQNTIFLFELASDYYHQPNLVRQVLGPQINPSQIFAEPELMARLQAGQLDATTAYGVQPAAFGLPFLTLPDEINLGDAKFESRYRQAVLTLNGKKLHPDPLVFYAAALNDAPHPALAARFMSWLGGAEGRNLLAKYHYDGPSDAAVLTPQ